MFFRKFGLFAAAVLAVLASPVPAGATSYKAIWNPSLQTNGDLEGRLLLKSGSLFGTSYGYPGYGMVFKLTPSKGSWTAKKIFGFNGTSGSGPAAGLITDSTGALYGTASHGGAYGDGTVFKLTLSGGVWKETRLHNFGNGSDGANPRCDLIRLASNGTLYGTTEYGGKSGEGTVFSMTYSGGHWSEHVLHSFDSYSDGRALTAGVYRDTSTGALYGTTSYGTGYGVGGIFKLTRSGNVWKETDLHDFGSVSGDGKVPLGILIRDSNGVFYGTTEYGGAYGYGTVFQLVESGGAWIETVIWSFKGSGSGDGAYPWAGVHMDSSGTLYGTTNGETDGYGTVFKLSQSGGTWTETVLHTFGSGSDGSYPDSALVEDSAGNLYGATSMGGTYGWGEVFEISP